jgi:hypothetical protein
VVVANPVASTETQLAKDVAHFEVVERGEKFVKHAVSDPKLTAPESYCLDLSLGPMHYNDGGYWRPIDTTLSTAAARVGADIGQKTGGYESYFNLALSAPWTAEYRKGTQAIRFKPVRLQSGTKQWPVNQAVVGLVLGDRIRWANAFGAGIHLEWTAQPGLFAKSVIIDKPLTLTADLDLVMEVQVENLALPTLTPARFLALGDSCLRWPVTNDAENNEIDGKLLLSTSSGKRYLTHRVPRAWLDKAVYPVEIDYTVYDVYVAYAVSESADDDVIYWDTVNLVWVWSNSSTNWYVGKPVIAGTTTWGGSARFQNVQIPRRAVQTAVPTSQFTVTVLNTDTSITVKTYLSCSDEDNAAQIANAADWIGRTLTAAKVDWQIADDWVAGEVRNYPIIAPVQEVLDRDGWREGNAIMVFWDDRDGRSSANAHRNVCPWDKLVSGVRYPPQLRIYYSLDDFGQVF